MTPWLIIAGIVGCFLVLRLILFRGPLAKPVTPPPTGILDMHCHTAGIGAGSRTKCGTAGNSGSTWDRDFKLKAALGVRPEVFALSRDYFGLR